MVKVHFHGLEDLLTQQRKRVWQSAQKRWTKKCTYWMRMLSSIKLKQFRSEEFLYSVTRLIRPLFKFRGRPNVPASASILEYLVPGYLGTTWHNSSPKICFSKEPEVLRWCNLVRPTIPRAFQTSRTISGKNRSILACPIKFQNISQNWHSFAAF